MRDRVCPVLSELMLQGARAECEQARVKLAAEYDIEGIRSVAEGCPVGVMLWQARRDAATATRRADALESLLTTVAEAMQGVGFAGTRDTIVSALEAVEIGSRRGRRLRMPEGDVHTTADGHRLVLRRPVDPARRCRECVFSPPGGTACCTAPDCGMSAPPEERLVWVPADAPTPVAGVPVAAPAGITLRDWFAGLALAGLMALPGAYTDPAKFAPAAYWYADAMLAARERAAGEARE